MIGLESATLFDRFEQLLLHLLWAGVGGSKDELELRRLGFGGITFGHGRVDTDPVAHRIAMRLITEARLASDEVQVVLLVFVVKGRVDIPELFNLLVR